MLEPVIRVLVVDDSAMVRKVLSIGLSTDPLIEVVGAASNAETAMQLIRMKRPDVITLDLEMPNMGGLDFLRQVMPKTPIPTVVISSLTREGGQATIVAMEAGAVDVIAKPSLGVGEGLPQIMRDICARVRSAATARVVIGRTPRILPIQPMVAARQTTRTNPDIVVDAASDTVIPVPTPVVQSYARPDILAIGASTGGVQALSRVLPAFPADAPPIVIVQHMPVGFTGPFANRLSAISRLHVTEAMGGEVLEPGLVLLAPGGPLHMVVERDGRRLRARLIEGDPVCFARPSVDVLFHSVARVAGPRAAAAVLTGMGRDGAQGLLAIRQAGGRTLAQDEATSVVYGMPMAARDIGAADEILPIDDIPARLLQGRPVTTKAARG